VSPSARLTVCACLVQFDAKAWYNPEAETICSATAYATSFAESASGQAKLIKGIWENTCNPYYSPASNGEADFTKYAYDWAKATIDVRPTCALTLALRNCQAAVRCCSHASLLEAMALELAMLMCCLTALLPALRSAQRCQTAN
jgi:hypothetical protein